jgi:hypothetical protein
LANRYGVVAASNNQAAASASSNSPANFALFWYFYTPFVLVFHGDEFDAAPTPRRSSLQPSSETFGD